MPAAGALRHRVRIEARDAGLDTLGQPNGAWSEVATVWASVGDQQSRESVAAVGARESHAMVNQVMTSIRLRYRGGIVPEMRVVDVCSSSAGCNGRTFDIAGVRDPDGRRRDLVLDAVERRVETD